MVASQFANMPLRRIFGRDAREINNADAWQREGSHNFELQIWSIVKNGFCRCSKTALHPFARNTARHTWIISIQQNALSEVNFDVLRVVLQHGRAALVVLQHGRAARETNASHSAKI